MTILWFASFACFAGGIAYYCFAVTTLRRRYFAVLGMLPAAVMFVLAAVIFFHAMTGD